jgi:hypothetical protein
VVAGVRAGVDKSNTFYGQVVLAAGNIAERLLQEGYGKLVEWTAKLTTDYEKLIAAQKYVRLLRNERACMIMRVCFSFSFSSVCFHPSVARCSCSKLMM